jgi:hypothetical protein
MKGFDQLISAMLVMVFAAAMMVVGHMYREHRAHELPPIPAAQMVSMRIAPL